MNSPLGNAVFQFTTSQGGRHSAESRPANFYIFQFTTSQGGRPCSYQLRIICSYLSIHDLTRRSTFLFHLNYSTFLSFNSRPHKEVDVLVNDSGGKGFLSIHDLTRRSTKTRKSGYIAGMLSIHDLTRRSTSAANCAKSTLPSFNSRPHKEVDDTVPSLHLCFFTFQFTTSQGGRLFFAAFHAAE